jgi:hypothetical protein
MPKRRRHNPSLLLFHNPNRRSRGNPDVVPQAPFAWEKFHQTDRDRARLTRVPDISGLPEIVVALGLAEGVEMVDEHGVAEQVMLDPTRAEGPWLVMDEGGQTVWIVGREPVTDLLAYDGYRSKAVMYFPPSNSGKYESGRGFRHEWGEGGRLPKKDWPAKAYPMLSMVDSAGRAFVFTDGDYHVEPRGIVG